MKHLLLLSFISFFTITTSAQVYGCPIIFACNYHPDVPQDDFSFCDVSCFCEGAVGCMDEAAINYDPEASYSAVFSCVYPQLDIDFDDDGVIGAADLVVFLSYYGGDWPQ